MKTVRKTRPVFRRVKAGTARPWPPGQGRWRQAFASVWVVGLLALGLAGGVSGAKEPLWWQYHKTEDVEFLYYIADAEACPTEQAARDAALMSAQETILKTISTDVAKMEKILRTLPTSLVGLDELYTPTEHGPQGWTCWVMVSYPKALRANLITNLLARPQGPPRRKVLVAPVAFDDWAVKEFPAVVAKYRQFGYGLDLWQTVEDKLEDSDDFEPDTRPAGVMNQITEAATSGAEVPEDIPEYLLVPNASFFQYEIERVRWFTAMTSQHLHVSVHLRLYHRVLGHWQYVATAQADQVDIDALEATNQSTEAAVAKLIERWRYRQTALTFGQK